MANPIDSQPMLMSMPWRPQDQHGQWPCEFVFWIEVCIWDLPWYLHSNWQGHGLHVFVYFCSGCNLCVWLGVGILIGMGIGLAIGVGIGTSSSRLRLWIQIWSLDLKWHVHQHDEWPSSNGFANANVRTLILVSDIDVRFAN